MIMPNSDARHSDSSYSDHLINQIHANLDLLLQDAKISSNAVDTIKANLPPQRSSGWDLGLSRRTSGSSPRAQAPSTSQPEHPPQTHHHEPPHPQLQAVVGHQPISFPNPSQTPSHLNSNAPRYKQARALWPYHGSAADDLSFEKGDLIIVLAEENQDWWRGRLLNGPPPGGLFPSNHVELISGAPQPLPSSSSNGPPESQQYRHHHPQSNVPHYPPPPPSQGGPGWQASPYGQAPPYSQAQPYGDYKAPQPAPAPPVQHTQSAPPVNVTVEKPKKNLLQGRFGQALAGGAGFGAGSAVATHVVNAIL